MGAIVIRTRYDEGTHSSQLRLIPYLHHTSSVLELLSEIFNEGGIKIISLSNIRPIIIYFHSSQCRLIPYLNQRPIFFQNKLGYYRHFRTYSRCAMFDWSDTVFRRRNVTRGRISNTVLQPRYWGREADSPEVCRLEGTESAEVATSDLARYHWITRPTIISSTRPTIIIHEKQCK
jgi:hypothetical protein